MCASVPNVYVVRELCCSELVVTDFIMNKTVSVFFVLCLLFDFNG